MPRGRWSLRVEMDFTEWIWDFHNDLVSGDCIDERSWLCLDRLQVQDPVSRVVFLGGFQSVTRVCSLSLLSS